MEGNGKASARVRLLLFTFQYSVEQSFTNRRGFYQIITQAIEIL